MLYLYWHIVYYLLQVQIYVFFLLIILRVDLAVDTDLGRYNIFIQMKPIPIYTIYQYRLKQIHPYTFEI